MFKKLGKSSGLLGGFFILGALLLSVNGVEAVKMGTASDNEDNEQQAEVTDTKAQKESIFLNQETIAKGYTVTSFNNDLKLSLVPGVLSEGTQVDTRIVPEEQTPVPWRWERISRIYQFNFRNKKAYDDHKPFYIQLSYDKDSFDYKKVFFYDSNHNKWRPLPTTDHPREDFVRSLIHLPFARIAVFANNNIMGSGKASWYEYEGGDFVASPDFPKGSILRVFNLENDKFVDVEVNDYGPDRSIFPDRAVDLDKQAFRKIEDPGAGIIDVKVEPLRLPEEESYYETWGMKKEGISVSPELSSKAGVILTDDKEVVWGKNADKKLPIASLTKLVAIKVFLNQDVSLDKEVVYLDQDAEHNYKYCKYWNSSHIDLKEGDIVTARDLIYSSLVGSANNAVETLVRASGLERRKFVDQMNQYVRQQGFESTHFVEPTGLSPDNVSSAKNYAIIMTGLAQEPLIRKVSTAEHYEFTTKNTDRHFEVKNTNDLLSRMNIKEEGIHAKVSKTGYLDEAGYCLVLDINNPDGDDVIALVLDAPTREVSFLETRDMIKYGLEEVEK